MSHILRTAFTYIISVPPQHMALSTVDCLNWKETSDSIFDFSAFSHHTQSISMSWGLHLQNMVCPSVFTITTKSPCIRLPARLSASSDLLSTQGSERSFKKCKWDQVTLLVKTLQQLPSHLESSPNPLLWPHVPTSCLCRTHPPTHPSEAPGLPGFCISCGLCLAPTP